MSAGGPTRAEIPPDTRPSALLLGGLRRGVVQVFVPVALAAQALAWTAYAITGAYRPWSWLKIGFAYTLASVRVPFLVTEVDRATGTPVEAQPMMVALGALTVGVIVLAFRAGSDQARGLERRPAASAVAGATVGIGFALPSLLIAIAVRLAFPGAGVSLMRPVLWASFVLPLVVAGGVGALGAFWRARERLEATRWGRRVVRAARAGVVALGWGLGLAFTAFLLVAAIETDATQAYGRTVGGWGGAGATMVVHHALLLPNQSAMVLAAAMGAPVELVAAGEGATIALTGIDLMGDRLRFLGALFGADPGGTPHVDLPAWYLGFALIPLVATIAGGRRAGEGAGPPRERALVGALAGVVYAVGATAVAWAATLVVPVLPALLGGTTRLGPDLARTLSLALVWGVGGCVVGALLAPLTIRKPR